MIYRKPKGIIMPTPIAEEKDEKIIDLGPLAEEPKEEEPKEAEEPILEEEPKPKKGKKKKEEPLE